MMRKLSKTFYQRDNVLLIAKQLLGKILVTRFNGIETSGRIVEVEAYAGVIDKASHAFGGKKTSRNKVMYTNGGVAYVYLCYGIHHLFNVVTNIEGIPHAILIRAVEPLKGIKLMMKRTGKKKPDSYRVDYSLTKGPGNVSKTLGIITKLSGASLQKKTLFIAEDDFELNKKDIADSPRIGVNYAGEDAKLAYRFFIKGNPFVSSRPK